MSMNLLSFLVTPTFVALEKDIIQGDTTTCLVTLSIPTKWEEPSEETSLTVQLIK